MLFIYNYIYYFFENLKIYKGRSNVAKKECVHAGHRERMRSKILNNHVNVMLDHELLEVLLYYSLPRQNTNEIAHELIQSFGTLANVFKADADELHSVCGVSMKSISLIKLFQELFNRYNELIRLPRTKISSTSTMHSYFEKFMNDAPEEELFIAYIDESLEIYACEKIATGSSSEVGTTMDDIILNIQRKHPSKIALSHNHPFTSCMPSRSDVISTFRIKLFLRLLNIELVEHIIFGNDGYCSCMDVVNNLCMQFDDALNDVSKSFDYRVNVQRHKVIQYVEDI